MSIKEIIKIPNPFLKVVAKPVIDIDENILVLKGSVPGKRKNMLKITPKI